MHDPKKPETEVDEIGGEPVNDTGFESEQPENESPESSQKGDRQ